MLNKGVLMARTINHEEFEAKKAAIINASILLIQEQGYKKFSINQVIKKCDISKGSFFHHFKSKEDLVEGLVDSIMYPIRLGYDEVMAMEGLSAKETLLGLFEVANKVKTKDNLPLTHILRILYQDENIELYHRLSQKMFNMNLPYFEAVFNNGTATGEFNMKHPTGSVRHFLKLIMGMNEQIGKHVFIDENPSKDWNCLYEELLAFEDLLKILLGITEDVKLYGDELHTHVRSMASRQ